jgi:short-subunit dehydrogenase
MTILITGASKGIGFEMVKQLSENPNTLVIAVSRNIAPLTKLIDQKNTHSILPVKADITSSIDQKKIVKIIFQKIKLKIYF